MAKFAALFTLGIGVIAVAIVLSFLLSWPVMALWNDCLVPAVTWAHEIGWLQAWGLSVLIALLFKTNTTTNTK